MIRRKVSEQQYLQTLQQALQQNAKSTALKPLGGMAAILLAATILGARFGMEEWLLVMLATLTTVDILLFFGFYVYFAVKDPELLRSEKFVIQKLALQYGLVGDDISGFVKIPKIGNVPLIEDNSQNQEKGK